MHNRNSVFNIRQQRENYVFLNRKIPITRLDFTSLPEKPIKLLAAR